MAHGLLVYSINCLVRDHSRYPLYTSTKTLSYTNQINTLLHVILTIFFNVVVFEVFPVDEVVHVVLVVCEGELWDLGDLVVLFDEREL